MWTKSQNYKQVTRNYTAVNANALAAEYNAITVNEKETNGQST